MIEFTHGLWVANNVNATLLVPVWMLHILKPFDTTFLKSLYCYEEEPFDITNKEVIEITSEDSLFLYKIFKNPYYDNILPKIEYHHLIKDMSSHFINVYCALWSHPIKEIIDGTGYIISQFLENNFSYTAVHKRSLEGGCSKLTNSKTSLSDWESTAELPMNIPEWQADLGKNHPICDMTGAFVSKILNFHNKTNSKLFVAFDGRGDVTDYLNLNAIFSTAADRHALHTKTDKRFLDMFVAINSDFFIMNPMSTFSLEIYIIRLCFSLRSIPIIKNNDFYMRKIPDELISDKRDGLWVNWISVIDAKNYNKEVHESIDM